MSSHLKRKVGPEYWVTAFLTEARSIFDAAMAGKPMLPSDRDQLAFRFHVLINNYMRGLHKHAIGRSSLFLSN